MSRDVFDQLREQLNARMTEMRARKTSSRLILSLRFTDTGTAWSVTELSDQLWRHGDQNSVGGLILGDLRIAESVMLRREESIS
jgi:hypothetical protein